MPRQPPSSLLRASSVTPLSLLLRRVELLKIQIFETKVTLLFFFPNEKDLNKYENSILTYYDVKKINLKEHIPFKLI